MLDILSAAVVVAITATICTLVLVPRIRPPEGTAKLVLCLAAAGGILMLAITKPAELPSLLRLGMTAAGQESSALPELPELPAQHHEEPVGEIQPPTGE